MCGILGCEGGRRRLLYPAFLVWAACAAAGQPVEPALFAEGVISTSDYELNTAFLPDGRTVFRTTTRS